MWADSFSSKLYCTSFGPFAFYSERLSLGSSFREWLSTDDHYLSLPLLSYCVVNTYIPFRLEEHQIGYFT